VIGLDPLIFVLAVVADLVVGDPRWLPHPVVYIGRLISWLETVLRRMIRNERAVGVLLLLLTVFITVFLTWLMLYACWTLSSLMGFVMAVFLSATCLAARSLHAESAVVAQELDAGDVAAARQRLSWIVGRDTDNLDESEIWRALIETVAENTSDGVITPMFWLTIGGPVAGMAFKAVSTLDSMVGYKNERYLHVGRASARMDDLLNFIPARLTGLLLIICAPLCGCSLSGGWRIFRRDRRNHPSPNSAHPESAAAGALGIRLGGTSTYGGRVSSKQFIGDPLNPIDGRAYRGMIRLMYTSALLMALICTALAVGMKGLLCQ